MEQPKKLPKGAYGGMAGIEYIPYIADGAKHKGGNLAVLLIGAVLAIIFAASTAYSGMKAGMTVAAGIPGSILGSALVAVLARSRGVLGKNLTQVMATGGESIASGMIFVLPAVVLIGSKVNFLEGFIVGVGGVAFGIGIASIVYKHLVIEEHGKLMYPESMAISETLVAGESGGDALKAMGVGFGIGGILTLFTENVFNKVNNTINYVGDKAYQWRFSLEANPMLMGIGFIVGLETAMNMFAGSFLAAFAIVPLIGYFAGYAAEHITVWNDASLTLNSVGVGTLSGNYVRYVGAGMMLCGGLIGAIRLIPTIISSIKDTFGAKSSGSGAGSNIGLIILLVGVIGSFVAAFIISGNPVMAIVGAILVLLLAMLFVIVAGRLTGIVGTSNLPVSGMTIASLVIMTLIFVLMGWSGMSDNKSILLFGTFIVIAISAAGGYTQAQKATFIIGGNKSEADLFYFIAGIIGVATVTGVIMLLSSQFIGEEVKFALPQANMISTLTRGIMEGDLPWTLILAGMAVALFFYFLKLPIMSIAVGFYLPIATTAAVLLGALIRVVIEKITKDDASREYKISNGVGVSSGLIAGASIIGLIGIVLQVFEVIKSDGPQGFMDTNEMGLIFIGILAVSMFIAINRNKK